MPEQTEAIKKVAISMTSEQEKTKQITYQKLFWLFMVGSVVGVPLEGLWCLLTLGHWETHVVPIWGPFCIIYGLGAVGFYIGAVALKKQNIIVKFIIYSLIATIVEFLCGWVLEYGLNMYAWDYSDDPLNIKGYVSLGMSLIWGVLGIAFNRIVPFLDRIFAKMKGKGWRIACICLTIFMIINFIATVPCFIRWKQRHEGIAPKNSIEQMIDETYDDARMAERYCEWHFIS